MKLKKGQLAILIVNILILVIYTIIFLNMKNYEFLMYIGVIFLLLILVIITNMKVNIPNFVLWGLSFWSLLHMSGGGIFLNGKRLYGLILINIVGEPYNILRYDQFVHIFGFAVATLLVYYLLKPALNEKINKKVSLGIAVIMAGLGLGALNEIIEFIIQVILPETGIGGYVNTSLDLVSDLIGAILAYVIILIRGKNV